MSINNSRFSVELEIQDVIKMLQSYWSNLPDISLVHWEDFQPKTGAWQQAYGMPAIFASQLDMHKYDTLATVIRSQADMYLKHNCWLTQLHTIYGVNQFHHKIKRTKPH